MLSMSVIEEIAFYLEAGQLSQRAIARKLRVGRATVAAIARGRLGIRGRNLEPQPPESEDLDPPARCPQCGYLVQLPCLVCRAREYRHGRRVLAQLASRRPLPFQETQHRPVRRRRSCHRRVA